MTDAFAAGDRFLLNHARLLERRVFATCFLGQSAQHVVDALRGYQNDDGGFGHALEPDKRCPASLPVDVETAFQALATAGASDHEMLERACDFLARAAAGASAGTGSAGTGSAGTASAGTGRAGTGDGASAAVPLAFDVIEQFPRAVHWAEWAYQPGFNPTAGLVGLLYQLGFDHPWRDAAAAWCWQQLDSGERPGDAHALKEVLVFLEYAPERERAEKHAAALAADLDGVAMFHLDPAAAGYGLTPLDLAPLATSRWRSLFGAELIDGHLDRLERAQQDDGGWPISWEPPSEAATYEWRGIVTVGALRTLTSYGRIAAAA